jgi:uncharacterized protein (DUF2062 family)
MTEVNGHPSLMALLAILVDGGGRASSRLVEVAVGVGIPALIVDASAGDDPALPPGIAVERLRLTVGAGRGTAILAAARLAKERGYKALVTIDGDGWLDPTDLLLLLDTAAASWPALVIASLSDGKDPGGIDMAALLVRLECGESLPDTRSGLRLYPVDFLASRHFISRGHGLEVEALVRGAWAGLPLLTVGLTRKVSHPPGPDRNGRGLRDSFALFLLHSRLLARSLLPWPHRRILPYANEVDPLLIFREPLIFFRLLCREHASAAELAAASWVGIFIGSLPIIPFGIVTIVYVNHKLHLNKLAGVAASNVCVFPFVPFLCVEAGHFFIHGRFWSEFNRQTLIYEIHHRLWEWLLGALVIGPLIAFAGALLTYVLVRHLRTPAETV